MKVKHLENYLLWTYVLKWRSTLQHNLLMCKYLGQVQNTKKKKVIFAKEIKNLWIEYFNFILWLWNKNKDF